MKKLVSIILLLIMMMTLTACSNKEGVAPYELSEKDKYILQSFNMEGTSQIISFNAPKEARSLRVNVYRLEDDKNWISIGGDEMSIEDQSTGTFAMQLQEDYSIEINTNGAASYKTNEIIIDSEITQSTKQFLTEFKEITINKEMPVALMVYDSGNGMEGCALEDFFEPSKFKGVELVQVVTLEFSDKQL